MIVQGPLKVAQLEWFTDAGKPAAGGVNTYRAIYITDKKQIQISDGTQWNPMSVTSNSVLASRPAASAANQYQTWYTTDDNNLWISTGTVWTQVTAAPADGSVTGNKLDGSTVSWSGESLNIGIAASVAANAMTIALKTKAGTDASASDYINVAFRNSTAATGTYVVRKITAALSTVISSGSTAGSTSGNPNWIYVYLIDNAGTVELAWSGSKMADEGSLVTTTAEGGAGAADSKTTLYSTTARSNVACRLIGRIKSTQATAGTWASSPTEISLIPFNNPNRINSHYVNTPNGYGSTNTQIRKFTTVVEAIGTAITYTSSATNGDSWTINEDGVYFAIYNDSRSGGPVNLSIHRNSTTTLTSGVNALATSIGGTGINVSVSATFNASAGDVIRVGNSSANSDGVAVDNYFRIMKIDG